MDAFGNPVSLVDKPKAEPEYGFIVVSQKVDLDVDFSTQSLTGHCEITILPNHNELKEITLDARQCVINSGQVKVEGSAADFSYEDSMEVLDIHDRWMWGVHQAELQMKRLKPVAMTEETRAKGPLVITLPPSIKITEIDPLSESAAPLAALRGAGLQSMRTPSVAPDAPASAISATPRTAAGGFANFKPLVISIDFAVNSFREGLHWVGVNESDERFPHVYTRHSIDRGIASSIFPCVDDSSMRCSWDISIRCSRTMGDALKRRTPPAPRKPNDFLKAEPHEEQDVNLDEDEKLLEMIVVCSGELTNDITDTRDSSKKIVTFLIEKPVAPQHIGFSIGPFEQVDLSEFREVADDEKLGQRQVIPMWAYCLPHRSPEVRHLCAPLAHTLDYFLLRYGSYPFRDYRLVFVDDQVQDTEHAASLTICSNRLLFPEKIIDPEVENVRTLVHGIASQWIGVGITPAQPQDRWVTIGLSHYITGIFMKTLCGHNEYAFRQKTLSDKLVELDFQRPSLYALGPVLNLGSFNLDFMSLKAPLVMFILDRRLHKATGTGGLARVIQRLVLIANTASENTVTTEGFRKLCEKITKFRQLETFWNQWVLGAGCPRFTINQKFNKKRLCVELHISQKQDTLPARRTLEKASFLREVKEEIHGIYAPDPRTFFTGPMTIRIHEADGTPYEHIVEIREASQKIDIPYNTKYKRLKRSRKQKERLNAGADQNGEGGDDSLLYCLGDVLQRDEDKDEWGLRDWDADTEAKMDMESYEWIRVDADFEWLCEKTFPSMASYMYVSQLQQDRDVVAQQESMMYLQGVPPHPLVSTFLTRTMMDTRYFHGIRTMAALALKTHAGSSTQYLGMKQLEKAYSQFYCYPNSVTPKPNDFSDKRAYKVELAIIKSLSMIRDNNGNCPKKARTILLDILRFNENSSNQFSDNFKITTLLSALADCLIAQKDASNVLGIGDDDEDPEPTEYRKSVVDELDRYRRNDEWINSYHNSFTVTVLDCKQRLMKAKVIPLNAVEFAHYLHDGSSEYVRIKAFAALIELGYLTNNAVACLLLNCASTDASPYTRRHLFEIFCVGVAAIAFGQDKKAEPPAPKTNGVAALNGEHDVLMSGTGDGVPARAEGGDDGLIIEEDATREAEARALYEKRTKTLEGALEALKTELKDNEELKNALWRAIKSPVIGYAEQLDILDMCQAIYAKVESLTIKLMYPKYWTVSHMGKGKLVFSQRDKIRTKPFTQPPNATLVVEPPKAPLPPTPGPVLTPMALPKQVQYLPPSLPKPKGLMKLTFNNASGGGNSIPQTPKPAAPSIESMAPPPPKPVLKRPAPEHTLSVDDRPRKRTKVVKMPLGKENCRKAAEILRRTPNPAPIRAKSSTKSESPGPRPSPRPSPAPKASPTQRHALPSGNSGHQRTSLPPNPSGIRKPLPGASTNGRHPLPNKLANGRTPLLSSAAPRTALPPSAPAVQRNPLPPSPAPSSNSHSTSPAPSNSSGQARPNIKFRKVLPDAGPGPGTHTGTPANPSPPAPKRSMVVVLKAPKEFLQGLGS